MSFGVGDFVIQILNGLSYASFLFLVAAGLSIIFGVTRIINLAHGSFYMLGAYLAVSLDIAISVDAGRVLGGHRVCGPCDRRRRCCCGVCGSQANL